MAGFVTKRWEIGFLPGYCFFILSITFFSRTPTDGKHFEPRFFWPYEVEVSDLREQILFNVVGFVQIGLIGGMILSWRILPAVVMFSAGIEILQLVSMRGLFEFDDIIHNTLGAVVGYGLCIMIEGMDISAGSNYHKVLSASNDL